MSMFDWVELKDGRARFAGGIRGWDELGHQTFAVDLDGTDFFGEVEQLVVAEPYDFNLEILSFGYRSRDDAGMPPSSRAAFAPAETERIRRLVQELIATASSWPEKPFVMQPLDSARFLGAINFRDGWINAQDAS